VGYPDLGLHGHLAGHPACPAGGHQRTLPHRRLAGQGPETFADWPDTQATAEQAAAAFFRGERPPSTPLGDPGQGRIFAYGVDRLGPPAWARQAVIYQVFVDRFYPGHGRSWLQTTDLRGFCGGTLWGLAEKLDYVAGLGINCLWLSPIFPSPTHHGYDATDLRNVEPRLGGNEALRALVTEAHRRDIRVLLDFVCNHVSDKHPLFLEARSNPNSPHRHWFTFDDSEIGYRTYFGVRSMPEVNVANPEARKWLIDAASFWLREFDVDGYRLDHAMVPAPISGPTFGPRAKPKSRTVTALARSSTPLRFSVLMSAGSTAAWTFLRPTPCGAPLRGAHGTRRTWKASWLGMSPTFLLIS